MPLEIKRKYACKDAEVLTESSEIVDSAIANLAEIVSKRPTWANPFFPNLKTRINNAFSIDLGVDNAADLRAKTALLTDIFVVASNQLTL